MNWTELNSRAYTPYSNKPRACLVHSAEGNYFAGVRIENVSYPITISSIQVALFSCISESQTPKRLILQDSEYAQLEYWKNEFDLEVSVEDSIEDYPISKAHKKQPLNEQKRLKELLDQAVTINSDFPVSCIIYTDSGYFEGINIEVSDWSMGLCAERVALAKAISEGVTELKAISIHTKDGEFSSPCGSCRQVIVEHLPLHPVTLYHADGSRSEHYTADFLPFSFSSRALQK